MKSALLCALLAAAPAWAAAAPSAEVKIAPRIENHEPAGATPQYDSSDTVFCWTKVTGEGGRTIRHIWKHQGRVVRDIPLKIPSDSYRTWTKKANLFPGHWTVAVVDQDGQAIAPEISFFVADSFDAAPGYAVEVRGITDTSIDAVLVPAAGGPALVSYSPIAPVQALTGRGGKLAGAPTPATFAKMLEAKHLAKSESTLENLLPGEKPHMTITLPPLPRDDEAFDLTFQAYLFAAQDAERSGAMRLKGLPNPARPEDWAATRRRLAAVRPAGGR